MVESPFVLPHIAIAVVAAASAAEPFKLAAPGLSYVNLDEKTGQFYLDYFSQQLGSHEGIHVLTGTEISAVVGMERQKQLMGCVESSCTAELAGALGADALILGSLAKAGGGFVANIKMLRARDGATIAVFSNRRECRRPICQPQPGADGGRSKPRTEPPHCGEVRALLR